MTKISLALSALLAACTVDATTEAPDAGIVAPERQPERGVAEYAPLPTCASLGCPVYALCNADGSRCACIQADGSSGRCTP